MLMSAVLQSHSVMHVYAFFLLFLSIMVYRRMLNAVAVCSAVGPRHLSIQYMSSFASANPSLLLHPSCAPFPLSTPKSVSVSVSLLSVS